MPQTYEFITTSAGSATTGYNLPSDAPRFVLLQSAALQVAQATSGTVSSVVAAVTSVTNSFGGATSGTNQIGLLISGTAQKWQYGLNLAVGTSIILRGYTAGELGLTA